jgi:hypothetical protein
MYQSVSIAVASSTGDLHVSKTAACNRFRAQARLGPRLLMGAGMAEMTHGVPHRVPGHGASLPKQFDTEIRGRESLNCRAYGLAVAICAPYGPFAAFATAKSHSQGTAPRGT